VTSTQQSAQSPRTIGTDASDGELVAATYAGDSRAYGLLWTRYEALARSVAWALVSPDRARADDIVSEAFARVLGAINRGGGPTDAFRPYLLMTVRNISADMYRRYNSKVAAVGHVQELEPHLDPVLNPDNADAELALKAWASLKDADRRLLHRSMIDELPSAQLGEELGLSAAAVNTRTARARERLRHAFLAQHIGGTAEAACRECRRDLAGYARGTLSTRKRDRVDAHLNDCDRCQRVAIEITDLNSAIKGLIGPMLLPGSAGSAGFVGLSSAKLRGPSTSGIAAGISRLKSWPVAAGVTILLVGLLLPAAFAAVVNPHRHSAVSTAAGSASARPVAASPNVNQPRASSRATTSGSSRQPGARRPAAAQPSSPAPSLPAAAPVGQGFLPAPTVQPYPVAAAHPAVSVHTASAHTAAAAGTPRRPVTGPATGTVTSPPPVRTVTDVAPPPAVQPPVGSATGTPGGSPTDDPSQPTAAAPSDNPSQPTAAAPSDNASQPMAGAPGDSTTLGSAQPTAGTPSDSPALDSAQPAAAAPSGNSDQPTAGSGAGQSEAGEQG
jgi:RNA polymerase sigma factor (sigma-70 family)